MARFEFKGPPTHLLFDPKFNNYGNENDLAKRSQVKHAGIHTGAYVFHYKGSTMNRHKGGTGGAGEENFHLGHHGATHHSHGPLLPDG